MGLSDAQIFGIQSVYYIVFCILEIPTGYLADRWGYSQCLKLGSFVLLVSNLLPVFETTYAGFLAHFLLIALSRSLISGALSAYLYEYLLRNGRVDSYKEAEGNARAFSLVGRVVFWAGVGAMMQWHITLPYWLTAVSAFISILFAFALPGLPKCAELDGISVSKRALGLRSRHGLALVVATLWRSPLVFLVMLQGVAIFTLARICQVNLFQPLLNAKSFDLSVHGGVMSLMTVCEALGSIKPGWVKRWVSDVSAVSILTVIIAMSLSLTAGTGSQVSVLVWLGVFSWAVGLSYPVQRQLLNDTIGETPLRATLLSVESLIDRAACAAVALVLGGYVAGGTIEWFIYAASAVSVAIIFVLAVIFKLIIDLSLNRH